MKQRVFEQVVVSDTLSATSQAYPLSGMNNVRLEITLVSSSGAASVGLKYYPSYSVDGQNWDDDSVVTHTTGTEAAPYRELYSFSGPSGVNLGGYRYVRAHVTTSDTIRTLVSMDMALYSVNS